MKKQYWNITKIKDKAFIIGTPYERNERYSTVLFYEDEEVCTIFSPTIYWLDKKLSYLTGLNSSTIKYRNE